MSNLEHFFFDGYEIDNSILGNIQHIEDFIKDIKKIINKENCTIDIIPYFDGKVKEDGGISCVINSEGFHFTCHTFSYKNTVFIDCFGKENCKEEILPIIIKYFKTDNYDLCDKNEQVGNFGKHLIFNVSNLIEYNEGIDIIKKIIKEIDMHPIYNLITNYKDNCKFDLIQLIAESHISIHRINNKITVDVFSCKNFDEKKVVELFKNKTNNLCLINRGVYYK